MRNAFAQEMIHIAGEDDRIVLLSGDIGNRLFDPYKERFPCRFYNCGVAEANMTGVAAGLALSGLKPVTYTIAAFNTLRCLEQIRLDICYHNLPVVLVGVGAGLSYTSLNATHHALEDVACLRVLPNMIVLCPGDAWEVRGALRAALKHNGPVYIRFGKKNEPLVHQKIPEFQIGKGLLIRDGEQICILSNGTLLPTVLKAADILDNHNISTRVISLHTVKPLDEELLQEVFDSFPLVVTVEEHSLSGGLGGSIAEWLADRSFQNVRFIRVGTPDRFLLKAGGQKYMRENLGLTPDAIATRLISELEKRHSC